MPENQFGMNKEMGKAYLGMSLALKGIIAYKYVCGRT